MKRLSYTLAALLAALPAAGQAGEIVRHPAASANAPILAGVSIPADAQWLILSGQVPPQINSAAAPDTIAAYGDTKTQAIGAFDKIQALLAAQGYGLGDVVKLTVFLVGDPANGGKLDFKGFSEAYAQYFGTAAQPNKVARSVVQVSALANPGFLTEIEATAAKATVGSGK